MTALAYKRLQLAPNGPLKYGYASYSVDPETGTVVYEAMIHVQEFIFSKDFATKGPYKIDPALLKSANLQVGQSMTFGALTLTVSKIENGVAQCDLMISQPLQMTGKAFFSVAGENLELIEVQAAGTAYGFNIQADFK
jgi:hypothetical protein